jgi:hypothetical protein
MSGYAPGTIRVWDGSAWTFVPTDWDEGSFEILRAPDAAGGGGTVSAAVATTTSCSRSPGTIRKGQNVTVNGATTGRKGGNLEFYYRVSGGSWVKFATRAAPTGGGTVSVSHAPGQSVYYYVRYTGTTGYKSSSSAGTAITTVETLKTVTKTVNNSWVQAFNGSGKRISGSGRDNAVHQGYYSSTHGNRKSLVRFVTGIPAAANVTKAVFICNGAWDHWYQNAGGTIVLGAFIDVSGGVPTSWPASAYENKGRKAVKTGSWTVDISSWAPAWIERADFSGITIGPGPSTSTEYYGYSDASPDANDFQLQITYQYWS